jgi:hypothetical protein
LKREEAMGGGNGAKVRGYRWHIDGIKVFGL